MAVLLLLMAMCGLRLWRGWGLVDGWMDWGPLWRDLTWRHAHCRVTEVGAPCVKAGSRAFLWPYQPIMLATQEYPTKVSNSLLLCRKTVGSTCCVLVLLHLCRYWTTSTFHTFSLGTTLIVMHTVVFLVCILSRICDIYLISWQRFVTSNCFLKYSNLSIYTPWSCYISSTQSIWVIPWLFLFPLNRSGRRKKAVIGEWK